MSYELVTLRIKDILDRIDGVYNVHTYFRDIQNEGEFEKAFTVQLPTGNVLAAWMMTRVAAETDRPALGPEAVLDITHKIEMQGFYGLTDAAESERTFQGIVDNILTTFRAKYLLQDSAGVPLAGIIEVDAAQANEIGHGQFGSNFVHFARVLLSVKERVTA